VRVINPDRRRSPADVLVHSASIELTVHLAVLVLILFPLLAIAFPALLMLVAAVMLASSNASSALSDWLTTAGAKPLIAAGLVALAAGALGALWPRKTPSQTFKLRAPTGASGEKLITLTQQIWLQMGGTGPGPALRWFPAMDIAAYAAWEKGRPEVQLSAGLWQTAVAGEPIARAILAHELAHLRYRDPLLLAALQRFGSAMRTVLLVTALTGLLVVGSVLIVETRHMLAAHSHISALIAGWLRILGAASLVLILLPLAWLALQRQMAFITSLIEMRADVVGAAYTQGLRRATQLFATYEGIARSRTRAFIAALVSPRLTHIPERQRLAILGSSALLITPKISFFVFSVLLVFLLPINFATPLFLGGAANHLAMLSMACAFNCALVLMLLAGRSGFPIAIPPLRLFALAAASIVMTALPRINMEPLSYFAMSWLAGFGGKAADWSTLPHDFAVTLGDLSGKLEAALFNFGALVGAGIAFASLATLLLTGRWSDWVPTRWRLASALPLVLMGTIVAGHDPFRAAPTAPLMSSLATFSAAGMPPSILLCLPLLLPAMLEGLFALPGVIPCLVRPGPAVMPHPEVLEIAQSS